MIYVFVVVPCSIRLYLFLQVIVLFCILLAPVGLGKHSWKQLS